MTTEESKIVILETTDKVLRYKSCHDNIIMSIFPDGTYTSDSPYFDQNKPSLWKVDVDDALHYCHENQSWMPWGSYKDDYRLTQEEEHIILSWAIEIALGL